MKCPNCGQDNKGKVCKYCHTELPFSERLVSFKILLVNIRYIINCIFLPSAKVTFIIYTVLYLYIQVSLDIKNPLSHIGDYLSGAAIVCVIADLIYALKKYRRLSYKRKIILKKQQDLQKIMDTYYPQKNLLEEANRLADITNKTTDEKTFFDSYNRLIEVLTELKKYERTGILNGSPTEDLNNLLLIRDEETRKFYLRKKAYENVDVDIKKDFDDMNGLEFEHYCADLLQKNGFSNVEVTQGSGDHGIDILADKDDITYAIQCKCYSSNIGNAAVQQAHTGKSIYKRDIAVVLTNQYFTDQAKQEAAVLGVKLWDRDKLQEFISN